jgi:hypothetical protein
MKTIFKSKTAAIAFVTYLAGLVAVFVPSVDVFLRDNVATILMGAGVLNGILRLVTKDKVILFK